MVKRLLVPAVILTLVYVGGIYAFSLWEDWSYFDSAFYITMAITSVAAYGDMFPKTESGKMLLMVISLAGVANMLYIFSILADLMSRHDAENRKILESMMNNMRKPEVPKT